MEIKFAWLYDMVIIAKATPAIIVIIMETNSAIFLGEFIIMRFEIEVEI